MFKSYQMRTPYEGGVEVPVPDSDLVLRPPVKKVSTKEWRSKEKGTQKSGDRSYSKWDPMREFRDFMVFVAAWIDHAGWTSANTPITKGIQPTAIRAWDELWYVTNGLKVTKYHKKLSKRAVKWAANLSDEDCLNSDYFHEIRNVARSGKLSQTNYKY